MDVGLHDSGPPRYTGHCTKVHRDERAVVFQVNFFFLAFYRKVSSSSSRLKKNTMSLASSFSRADAQVDRLEEMINGLPVSPPRNRNTNGLTQHVQYHSPAAAAPAATPPAPTPPMYVDHPSRAQVEELTLSLSRANTRIDDLEKLVRSMMTLFQVSSYEMQLANEGVDPHARVKCLHSLPAFSTIIKEVDLLRPLIAPVVPVPVPPPAPLPVVLREEVRVPVPVPVPAAPALRIPCILGAEVSEYHSRGVKVVTVNPEGPCEVAGVYSGDLVISVDNHPVTCRADLRGLLAGYEPGTIATLLVERHGSLVTLPIMFGAAPTVPWTPGRRSVSPSPRESPGRAM